MRILGWVLAAMLMPVVVLAVGIDNRCPKGYVWSDSQKRCVTAPPQEKEGACTKSSKPWMLNCSTSKKPVSIDALYQSGYRIEHYVNGFYFIKKRGSSAEQECVAAKSTKAGPAAAAVEPPAPAK